MRAEIYGFYDDLGPMIKCRLAGHGKFGEDYTGGIELLALVDTGCTEAMISPAIAAHLSLPVHDTGTSFTASGDAPANLYMVDLLFNFPMKNGTPYMSCVTNLKAFTYPGNSKHQLVIGMGALKCFDLRFPPNFAPFSISRDF